MSAPRIVPLVVALVLTASVDLAAQQESTVAPGSRIRVSAPTVSSRPIVGEVVAVHSDTLVIDASAWVRGRTQWERLEEAEIPLGSLTRLEVSQGKKSNVGKGALIGGLVGAGVGLALGLAASAEDSEGFAPVGPEGAGDVLGVSAIMGGLGAGIGALIGAISPGERWKEVPLDRLRIDVTPVASGALGMGVRLGI